jgi:hypothetical protein
VATWVKVWVAVLLPTPDLSPTRTELIIHMVVWLLPPLTGQTAQTLTFQPQASGLIMVSFNRRFRKLSCFR